MLPSRLQFAKQETGWTRCGCALATQVRGVSQSNLATVRPFAPRTVLRWVSQQQRNINQSYDSCTPRILALALTTATVVEELAKMSMFMIGVGAIGCELLKNFAMCVLCLVLFLYLLSCLLCRLSFLSFFLFCCSGLFVVLVLFFLISCFGALV